MLERQLADAKQKVADESEEEFQAEASARMKISDRCEAISINIPGRRRGQVMFVGKVPLHHNHHFYLTGPPVYRWPFYIRTLNHWMLQVPGLADGWWAGVQFDLPRTGYLQDDRSMGIVDGVRYFKCERGSVAAQPFSFPVHAISQERILET